jgi:hypothetical protein
LLGRLEEPEFGKVACVARQIWLRRNKVVFEGTFTHPNTVARVAVEQLEFHLKVLYQNGEGNGLHRNNELEKWRAPSLGFVKLNWDAALDQQKKLMGVGIVVRDHTGGVIAA